MKIFKSFISFIDDDEKIYMFFRRFFICVLGFILIFSMTGLCVSLIGVALDRIQK